MYINAVFIGYMGAVFTGLINVIIMAFAIIKKEAGKEYLIKKIALFCVCSLLFVMLYFIFYYRENVWQVLYLELPWRLMDFLICPSLFFSWVLLSNSLGSLGTGKLQAKAKKVVSIAGAISLLWISLGVYMATFYMDQYYYISNTDAANFLPKLELILISFIIALIVYGTIVRLRDTTSPGTNKYLSVVSFALIVLSVSQALVNYNLYQGKFSQSAWELEVIDPTGPIFIIINIATTIFILKENFAPVYNRGHGEIRANGAKECDADDACMLLNTTAEKYGLTSREREIIGLVYEGFSNPDIGQNLYISNNTIKTHMRNIFRKLGVSSRIEMIHLINNQK